ncbi:MAG TPA: Ig-like domain-containing protein, partial [Kofleriaceae bacterium]|nr:Ig-like domain-containing protein [Kofleriaceae bacterium]
LLSWLVLVIAGGGCVELDAPAVGDPPEREGAPASRLVEPLSPAAPGGQPRGVRVLIPPSLERTDGEMAVATADGATILYMNRLGGVYTPGANDSRTNRSTIVGTTSSVPAWQVPADTWAAVMDCMRDRYGPFNVEVTDVDPGNVPHIESVIGGRPTDVGMPDGVAGVSPFTTNCTVIANSVVFTFAEVLGGNAQVVCEVAAQEVAHSFGLDHEYLCEDPMTYLSGCGPKHFQNVAASCGEYQPRPCRISGQFDCGRDTQNSYQLLADRIGLRPTVDPPPELAILEPADGAEVGPGFAVVADAVDDTAVVEVELLIDSASLGALTAPPYSWTAPDDLAVGAHLLEVTARDDEGESTASITVEVVPAGSEPDAGAGGGGDDGGGDGGGGDDGGGDGSGGGADAGPGGGGAGGDGGPAGASDGGLVGGCSAGGTSHPAAALLLALAVFLATGRARGRYRLPCPTRISAARSPASTTRASRGRSAASSRTSRPAPP